jgi:predicted nucleotidyltransferase
MLDLTPDQLALVRGLLARHVPDRQVRAFGSRVKGRARRWSDLDLVAMGREALPDLALAHLPADLEDSDLPFRVDLLEARDLPPIWTEGFESMSVPVYPARPDTDGATPALILPEVKSPPRRPRP